MSEGILCELCGKPLAVDVVPEPGQHVKCVHCGGKFSYSGNSAKLGEITRKDLATALFECRKNPADNAYYSAAPAGARLFIGLIFYGKHFKQRVDAKALMLALSEIEPELTANDIEYLKKFEANADMKDYFDSLFQARAEIGDIVSEKDNTVAGASSIGIKENWHVDVIQSAQESRRVPKKTNVVEIKCPECGQVCEADEEPDIGQHVVCPFCEVKFSYCGRVVDSAQCQKSPANDKQTPSGIPKGLKIIRHNTYSGNASNESTKNRTSSTMAGHKFCQNCGAQISDKAVVCVKCGVPVNDKALATVGDVHVPNHMVLAILSTVFCCLVGGIIAIVYAVQVNTKLAQGDISGAQSASEKAFIWIIANICIGVVGGLLNSAIFLLPTL